MEVDFLVMIVVDQEGGRFEVDCLNTWFIEFDEARILAGSVVTEQDWLVFRLADYEVGVCVHYRLYLSKIWVLAERLTLNPIWPEISVGSD